MATSPSWQGATSAQSWATAANWSTGVIPASTDTVTVENATSTISTSSGLNQAAVTLASLAIPMTFTGTMGDAQANTKAISSISRSTTTATATSNGHAYANGDTIEILGSTNGNYNGVFTIANVASNTFAYTVTDSGTSPETTAGMTCRKTDFIHISATVLKIGAPSNGNTSPAGSNRLKINTGANAADITVYGTSQSASDSGHAPVQLLGTHASNRLTVMDGIVEVAATRPGQTAQYSEINVMGQGANVTCGAGLTLATLNVSAGSCSVNNAVTTISVTGGSVTTNGDYLVTTMKILAGTVVCRHRKTGDDSITTLYGYSGGTLDLSGNESDIVIHEAYIEPGFVIRKAPSTGLTIQTLNLVNVQSITYG